MLPAALLKYKTLREKTDNNFFLEINKNRLSAEILKSLLFQEHRHQYGISLLVVKDCLKSVLQPLQ